MAQRRAASGHRGVQIRDGRIRVRVIYRGDWVYESTEYPPSARGLAQAARLRDDVNRESRRGHIVWADYFPRSSRAETAQTIPTFGEVADQWLRHRALDVTPSTWRGYSKRIEGFWRPVFGHMLITDIRKSHVKDALIAIGWSTGKTMSNGLTPLRGVFDLAIDDELISRNPAMSIRIPKTQRAPCNPYTVEEMHQIIAGFKDSPWQDYYRVAFGTGMRTSELIGLTWPDVDLRAGTVRIHSARTDGTDTGRTKTARERTLTLTPMAALGLRNQRWRSKGTGHVFLKPHTLKLKVPQPIHDDLLPRRALQRLLVEIGLPQRRAYDTRSTFATLHLMGGVDLLEVSQMLGHKNPSMTLDHYAAWLPKNRQDPVDLVMAFGC